MPSITGWAGWLNAGSPVPFTTLRPSWQLLPGGKCEHGNRTAVLLAGPVCVDRKGLFLPATTPPAPGLVAPQVPPVNLIASAPSMEIWLSLPYRHMLDKDGNMSLKDGNVTLIRDSTLYVFGSVWPYHLSHFMFNTALPLLQMIERNAGPDWAKARGKHAYQVRGAWGGTDQVGYGGGGGGHGCGRGQGVEQGTWGAGLRRGVGFRLGGAGLLATRRRRGEARG